ncbi:MAG: DNA translocase FtsK 4TM domain-containing protein [Candidatus Moraniibacteriota bacterium]
MGRKKKVVKEEEEGFNWEEILHSDAKRSIAAVFLFALAILFFLGYIDAAGVLGSSLDTGLGMLLGLGKWLLPLVLLSAALMFLRRRTTTLADAVKFIGLIVGFASLLGLLHLYTGDTTKEMLKVAEDGAGGGYIGFGLAYLLVSFTGKIAGTIIALSLFAVGMIAAFNVSLMHTFEHVGNRLKGKTADDESSDPEVEVMSEEVVPEEKTLLSSPLADEETAEESQEKDAVAEGLTEHNISKIAFKGEEEAEEDNKNGEEETVMVPAFIRPKRSLRRKYRWELPPVDLLESTTGQAVGGDTERNKHIIQSTLKHFGIEVEPGEVRVGPTVTQYTFRPAFGVKLSRITTLNSDLALALAAKSIRIEAPIPGQALIGIEVPNQSVATVRLKAVLESPEFRSRKTDLMIVLGEDVAGKHVFADLAKMPHILIAGRTGSGKSVCMNTFLLSLLYQNSPEDLQLILVDPKRVSFSRYKGIPHLKTPVVVESKKVVNVLRWAAGQMDHRYKILEEARVQDIQGYHELTARGEKRRIVDAETGRVTEEPFPHMPYIVIMIDEMADLMATHGKEVEVLIVRLASLSRAVGIHLVLATQRPEATVITGLIKANIPARISFQLKSHIDSRTILDTSGAEKLLGNGDMLYAAADGKEMRRIQGVFVSDDEVKRVTTFLEQQKKDLGEDDLGDDLSEGAENDGISEAMDAIDEGSKSDDLYDEVKRIVIETGRASTTNLQTTFGVGYPRAARLMHLLEENGVVGIVDGKKTVLLSKADGNAEGEEEPKQYGDDPLADQSERDKWQA